MNICKRSDIRQKLEGWLAGQMTDLDLHRWASETQRDEELDFDDWEQDRTFSVAKEALAELDMLDLNGVTRADAALFVTFLETPVGEFEKGYIPFIAGLQARDVPQWKASAQRR